MTDRDQLREKVARALYENRWDEQWSDATWFARTQWLAAADAVLDALQLEQVGWMGERGLFFPADLTPAPHWVSVYIVREAER